MLHCVLSCHSYEDGTDEFARELVDFHGHAASNRSVSLPDGCAAFDIEAQCRDAHVHIVAV